MRCGLSEVRVQLYPSVETRDFLTIACSLRAFGCPMSMLSQDEHQELKSLGILRA